MLSPPPGSVNPKRNHGETSAAQRDLFAVVPSWEPAGAEISPCGRYRWRLWRQWADLPGDWREGSRVGRVCFVMLNPSTADDRRPDPTLTRCVRFARGWGYGAVEVVNLYPYRATDAADLWTCAEDERRGRTPATPTTADAVITAAAARCSRVVCAWGDFSKAGAAARREAAARASETIRLLRLVHADLYHLGLTSSGQPRHPLYLPGDSLPRRWENAMDIEIGRRL